jgi:hypothetical protein
MDWMQNKILVFWCTSKLCDRTGSSALNVILKTRLAEIGEDPDQFSAHGLRSGFITEAFDQNIPFMT